MKEIREAIEAGEFAKFKKNFYAKRANLQAISILNHDKFA